MTGHLVMTTLHTNSATAAFSRLQDLGVSPHMMAGCLVGVIAQRLLRRLCKHCKRQTEADRTLEQLLRQVCAPAQTWARPVFEAEGCVHCRMSGYHGRLVIMEVLTMHADMNAMLTQPLAMQQLARVHGYTTLAEEGLQWVNAGETSVQELRRVVDLSALEAVVATP